MRENETNMYSVHVEIRLPNWFENNNKCAATVYPIIVIDVHYVHLRQMSRLLTLITKENIKVYCDARGRKSWHR